MFFFERRKNKDKRSHNERRVPNNAHYKGPEHRERIKTGEIMESDEEGSITNCLTSRKRPWMESSID
jgi:hypothetical protein